MPDERWTSPCVQMDQSAAHDAQRARAHTQDTKKRQLAAFQSILHSISDQSIMRLNRNENIDLKIIGFGWPLGYRHRRRRRR